MKQFNIAQFVLLAGSGIGLILLIFTGHPFEKKNVEIVHHKQHIKPKQHIKLKQHIETPPQLVVQSQVDKEKLLPEKERIILKEEEVSVVIKSPQRSKEKEEDSIGIWKSQVLNEPLLIENNPTDTTKKTSPFFIAKRSQTQNVSLSQTNDAWNSSPVSNKNEKKKEAKKEEQSASLPKESPSHSSHVRRNSPLYYSGKPSETEYQLDAIEQQLGTLANKSQRQYQQDLRQSATQVRSLQREMRINKLQQHLDQLKWKQSYRNKGSRRSGTQQIAQRYFFIGRQNNTITENTITEKPSQKPLPFLSPKREAKSTQPWTSRKIRK